MLTAEAAAGWLAAGLLLVLGSRLPGLAAARSDRGVNLWLVAHVLGLFALWLGRMATGTLPW